MIASEALAAWLADPRGANGAPTRPSTIARNGGAAIR